jgi:hypothetical protein
VRSVGFQNEVSTGQPIPHYKDAVFLEIDDAVGEIRPGLVFRKPAMGERLAILGINSYRVYGAVGDSVRLSSGDACYVAHSLPNGCVYHGCSTSPGFSGAPLMSMASGRELAIVGMHIAAAADHGYCAETSPSGYLGNIGMSALQFAKP